MDLVLVFLPRNIDLELWNWLCYVVDMEIEVVRVCCFHQYDRCISYRHWHVINKLVAEQQTKISFLRVEKIFQVTWKLHR